MVWIEYFCLIPILLAGIVLAVFNLPGLWLMAAAVAGFDWLSGWDRIVHERPLVMLLVMAGVAELIDFLAASGGAKRAGASGWGMVGAVVGGIVGGLVLSIPIFGIGTIIGICIGCFVGAAAAEVVMGGKSLDASLRVGLGAASGRLVGIMAKLCIGVAMLVVGLVAAFP